jgi:hypothetical protein
MMVQFDYSEGIVASISGPGEDEESELRAHKGFRILMVSDALDLNI